MTVQDQALEVARKLRDPAQVVLDPEHVWEDAAGQAVFSRDAQRGCVIGLCGVVADSVELETFVCDAVIGRRSDRPDWDVTRLLKNRGPGWCADRIEEAVHVIA